MITFTYTSLQRAALEEQVQDLQIQGHLRQYKRTKASARARLETRIRHKVSHTSHNSDHHEHSHHHATRNDLREVEDDDEDEEEDENGNIIFRLYERAEQDKAMVAQLRGDLIEAEERLEAFKVFTV